MRKPPDEKTTAPDHIKPNLKWPRDLHESLVAEAAQDDRSLNSLVISKLRVNQVELLRQENEELRGMVREILDIVREKLL